MLKNINQELKILFYEKNGSIEMGSHRIYMHNLRKQLSHLGFETAINEENFDYYDIIICGKNISKNEIDKIKSKKKSKCLVGIANNITPFIADFDFCISASQSEKVYSLKYQKNIVTYPQIENVSRNKYHNNSGELKLCYHGNKEHLNQMTYELQSALEDFSIERKIKLIAIYNVRSLGLWKSNRPKINIEDVQWNLNSFCDEIYNCDIGICPGLSPITTMQKKLFFRYQNFFSNNKVGNDNDYLIRFKNTSNAGRAFVFHQLNIPVISDIFPDSYHILQKHNCGFLAHSKESWLHALRSLSNSELRNSIAESAKNEFLRLYDPSVHASNLIHELLAIQKREKI